MHVCTFLSLSLFLSFRPRPIIRHAPACFRFLRYTCACMYIYYPRTHWPLGTRTYFGALLTSRFCFLPSSRGREEGGRDLVPGLFARAREARLFSAAHCTAERMCVRVLSRERRRRRRCTRFRAACTIDTLYLAVLSCQPACMRVQL